MTGDLGKSFSKLTNEMYFRYSGCLIERILGGFRVFGKDFRTLDEAKAEIDQRFKTWSNIMKQQKEMIS